MSNRRHFTVLFVCTDWYEPGGQVYSLINLIHSINEDVEPIVLLPNCGKVKDIFDNQNIETIVYPFFLLWEKNKPIKTVIHHPNRSTLYRSLVLNRRCAHYIKNTLKNRHIDIVHSNTSVTTVGHSIANTLHAKHIWHIRESLTMLGINPYGGLAKLRRKINQADGRIVISQAILNHWQLPKENTFVFHDAIFPSLPTLNETQRQKHILFCAAELNDFKGTPIAVEAFCKAHLHGYHLVLAGTCSESYKDKLLALASTYGKSDKLDFVGYQDNIEPLYRTSSLFMMCSKFEGLGRVTLEAMAYGCPVVALASGGTTDFIHNKETGWLFNTVDECAELLQHITNSDNSSIIQSARELIASEYTETVYGQQIINLYNSLFL